MSMNQTAGGGAGGGAWANKEPSPATLSDQLSAANNEVIELIGRVRVIAERVSGSSPRPVQGNGDASRAVPNLQSMAAHLRGRISELADELSRLDASI